MIFETNKIYLDSFELTSAKKFVNTEVCYTIYGDLNNGKKLALIFHGFSSNTLLHEWWNKLPINEILKNYNIICFNSLGSCHGSFGPESINLTDGKPYHASFPKIEIADTVNFIVAALAKLNLHQLDIVLGCSLGGMQAIDMFVRFPNLSQKFISVCGSTLSVMTKLINMAQVNILSSGMNDSRDLESLRKLMSYCRYFFRLSCTTENALNVLGDAQTKMLNKSKQVALETYFLNDSLKYENDFSPYSYNLYLKMLANFETPRLNQTSKSEIILVDITGDTFTPSININAMFDLFKSNDSNVTKRTFETIYGHEAWILDGEKFYEVIKSEFASESFATV